MNRGLAFLLACVVSLLFHAPAKDHEFLFYDDGRFIVRNDAIEEIGNPLRFFTDLSTTTSTDAPTREIYRPVRTLSYAVLTTLFGKDPGAFHALAILVHALTTGVLVLLLLRAGLGIWPSLVGALAWGLHPVHVESVAWVCSLGDLWCGLFAALAMLFHAGERRVLALLALAAALFSKEAAVVVPGLWLAWDWFLNRDRLKQGALSAVLPGLALVIGFLLFRGWVGAGMRQIPEPLGGSHLNAVLTMLAGLGFYATRLLFPHAPAFDARVEVPGSVLAPAVLLGVAVLVGLLWMVARGPRLTRLSAAWFLLALVPVSNVLVPLKIPTADRFLYLPAMGLAIAVGYLQTLSPRWSLRLAPLYLLLLGSLTLVRTGDFKDDAALIEMGKRVSPKSKTWLWAEASLAAKETMAAMQEGDFARAAVDSGRAQDLYRKFLANTAPHEQVQVHMEVGDFFHQIAILAERIDMEVEAINAYTTALEHFYTAHQLQKRGIGRVIEEERVHAARMGAKIAIRLAVPENPNLERTVQEGMEMLAFLEAEYGDDIALDGVKLVLIRAIARRAQQPEQVRAVLARVAGQLQTLEDRGESVTFLKAQTLYYLSILKDRDPDRQGLERAYRMYQAAARETPSNRIRALFHAGRAARTIGTLFKDAEWMGRARGILESLAEIARQEGIRIDSRLQRQIEGELQLCRSR
jgi:hypothetical protein